MSKRNLIIYSLAGVATLGGGAFSVANAATNHPARSTKTKAEREENYEKSLATAVTAGKLTATQEAAILAEHNKLEQELTAAPKTTEAERKATMLQIRAEADAWAKNNNIKVHWLLRGHRHLRGAHPTTTPTATPSS